MSASGGSGPLRVLFAGESWIKHTIHMKGFDQFHSTEYEEGAGDFLAALDREGFDVTYVRGHEISSRFPRSARQLDDFDVVVLSDIGSNSFLLPDETFLRSERSTNRLALLRDWTRAGGGLVMIGGYMSFTGFEGKARFGMTPLADVLPVRMLDHDDRIEDPEGVKADFDEPAHAVLGGTPRRVAAAVGVQPCDRQARRDDRGPCRGRPPPAGGRVGRRGPLRRVHVGPGTPLGAAGVRRVAALPETVASILGWAAGSRPP